MKEKLMGGLNKFQMISYDIIEVIAAIVLAATMIVTTIGIIFRYFLNNALPWTEEVCCILLVYLAYLTAGLATVSKSHVVADFLSQNMKGILKLVFTWFIRICELIFLGVVLYAMCKLFPTIKMITSALEISRKIYYIPMIGMTVYMIFAIVLDLLNEVFPGYNCWKQRQVDRDRAIAEEDAKLQAEALSAVDEFMDEVEGK